MTVEHGWQGRFFEDFAEGQVLQHPLGRTVTQADNSWFTQLTMNPNPIHFDKHYAAGTEYGDTLVNSTFTLALVTGLSVSDLSQNGVNLGWESVKIRAPLFEGETVYARSRILECRASGSRPHMGVIRARTVGYKPGGEVVIELERSILVYRRDHAPQRGIPAPRDDF